MRDLIMRESTPFYIKGVYRLFTQLPQKTKPLIMMLMSALLVVLPTNAAAADDGAFGLSNISFGTGVTAVTSGTQAWDLVDSSYSLNQLDFTTGMITGDSFGESLSMDYALQSDLMQTNQLAFDAQEMANQARVQAIAQKEAEDAKKKAAALGGGNYDTGECPTSAPGNTLRNGSESIGVHEICVRSVAQARSPEAAKAIIFALNHLGLPYSQPKRNQEGWYDCSSYTTRSYQAAGVNIAPPGQNAPSTRTMRVARWAVEIPFSELKPGDLVQPTNGHVAMQLADGWVVHTNRPGDVSHIRKAYTSAYWSAYVDPARV